jgi:hypothetical protein
MKPAAIHHILDDVKPATASLDSGPIRPLIFRSRYESRGTFYRVSSFVRSSLIGFSHAIKSGGSFYCGLVLRLSWCYWFYRAAAY